MLDDLMSSVTLTTYTRSVVVAINNGTDPCCSLHIWVKSLKELRSQNHSSNYNNNVKKKLDLNEYAVLKKQSISLSD